MTVDIELTDWQLAQLEKIRKGYAEHGLDYTLEDVVVMIIRTHMKEYMDGQIDRVRQQLYPDVRGRVKGLWRNKL